MDDISAAFDRLIERVAAWAGAREDIRAALILGSRARADRPADAWSDLDLVLFTTDPRRYIASTDWLAEIGPHWAAFIEPEDDETEGSVLFDGALDVDFVPILAEDPRGAWPANLHPDVIAALGRGFRFIVDKDGYSEALKVISAPPAEPGPPSEARFLNAVNEFWYHCVWAAKKLRRGEVWAVRAGLDGAVRWHCLLPMIEWHAKTVHGWDYDTWHRGRFLEQWADPRVIQGLREASSQYDADDVRRALVATMDLFRELATEAAARMGYPYPTGADESVTKWVTACLAACLAGPHV